MRVWMVAPSVSIACVRKSAGNGSTFANAGSGRMNVASTHAAK
jgi:hypothetical protein